MIAALLLATLLVTGPALPPTPDLAVGVLPDEPGAFFLPEAPTYQAVAADMNADGAPDVVRLVRGEESSIMLEAWTEGRGEWKPMGTPASVLPGRPAGASESVYDNTPARLIVRRVTSGERITLVRQPRFEEVDGEPVCCLLLDDLVVSNGALHLRSAADPSDSVDAISVVDFDGDGTDELLASRSLPPQGDISYPTAARVYRWNGVSFGPPTATELSVGSGDTPFVLGDSDGRPGDEAAIISTLGRPGLFRIRLGRDDKLVVDDAGIVVTDARAVPVADGRGLAVVGPVVGLAVLSWPQGVPTGEPVAQLPMSDGSLLGLIEIADQPQLLVHRRSPEALRVLGLPGLTEPRGGSLTRSPAAATFASSAVNPYVGPLPGGDADGNPAVIYAGRLLPSGEVGDGTFPSTDTTLIGTLAGAEPIGLVGRGKEWLAILHAPQRQDRTSLGGGRLDVPVAQPGSAVSVAPLDVARTPELNSGVLDPELRDASPLSGGELATPATGFTASVTAPVGSRIYVADVDPSVIPRVRRIPTSGRADIRFEPPMVRATNDRYRASMVVTTPAGHSYVVGWQVRSLVVSPPLQATVSTTLGSTAVLVMGETAPYAAVTVAGAEVPVDGDGHFATTVGVPPWPTDVRVAATDPVGNVAQATVTGVGLFDYRALPWVPIVAALVGLAGLALFLRVPRIRGPSERRTDDGMLEELEPD